MESKTALVVGARGVIGGNLVEHLRTLEDWNVIGLSRRGGTDRGRVRHLSVDLLDADATAQAIAPLADVTHVFYAAYQDRPTWSALVEPNVAMLTNVVDAIEPVAAGLAHVNLMQGYKVYGAHLGRFTTPAREDDPGHMPPEFNVDQQSFLIERSRSAGWTWSALRPSVVCGIAFGVPMNLTLSIAVYATMSKELGVPMRFPGVPGAYDTLLEMTDASLLSRAAVWAATEPAAANEAFNITNGDLFRWNAMWPKLADALDVEVGDPLPMKLADVMADKGDLWRQIIERHGLADVGWGDVAAWPFADAVFGWDYDMFADSSKARRFGFHDYVDTEAMFRSLFAELRDRRVIPGAV